MAEIYVTGHRNPDTDSIVSALAYANLRQSLGDREYRAARIGAVNDETQRLLDRFGVEPPMLIKTMKTQIADLEFDRPPALNTTVTIDLAWRTIREGELESLPIVNEDGTLYSVLSAGDIADYMMRTMSNNYVKELPLFNLVSTVEGTFVNEFATDIYPVSGEVFITLPQAFEEPCLTRRDAILVCGDQPDVVEKAIANGVNCIIICRADVRPEWEEVQKTCIISSPLSARRVSTAIFRALPVERICRPGDIVSFHLTDFMDDAQEIMSRTRYRSYPILDEEEKVVGTLSRFHLLRPKRKQVVLVDHNESAQSVPGLDQVEIVEIIDHHRLADIQTMNPIRVRNEPVGCTNTILATMYQERGVIPTPKMAGIMCGAILSDTVLFKSPTCTKRDRVTAERLARIAKVDLEELGKSLFSFGGNDKTAEELFRVDYKPFHISDQNIAVSQITCGSSEELIERKEEFLTFMRDLKKQAEFDLVLLMITDVLLEGTYLVYVGEDDLIRQAFQVEPEGNCVFLPGVMSRKKQIIPAFTALWG